MRTLNLFVDALLWAAVAVTLWVLWSVQSYILQGITLAVEFMRF